MRRRPPAALPIPLLWGTTVRAGPGLKGPPSDGHRDSLRPSHRLERLAWHGPRVKADLPAIPAGSLLQRLPVDPAKTRLLVPNGYPDGKAGLWGNSDTTRFSGLAPCPVTQSSRMSLHRPRAVTATTGACKTGRLSDSASSKRSASSLRHRAQRDGCRYKVPFGDRAFCGCPVRRAIFERYRV
jgi:hypothetical protein